jgi:hypothetical protein
VANIQLTRQLGDIVLAHFASDVRRVNELRDVLRTFEVAPLHRGSVVWCRAALEWESDLLQTPISDMRATHGSHHLLIPGIPWNYQFADELVCSAAKPQWASSRLPIWLGPHAAYHLPSELTLATFFSLAITLVGELERVPTLEMTRQRIAREITDRALPIENHLLPSILPSPRDGE